MAGLEQLVSGCSLIIGAAQIWQTFLLGQLNNGRQCCLRMRRKLGLEFEQLGQLGPLVWWLFHGLLGNAWNKPKNYCMGDGIEGFPISGKDRVMCLMEGSKVEDMHDYYGFFWRRERLAESCRNLRWSPCKARMALDKARCKATFCSCCNAPRMRVGQVLAQSCQCIPSSSLAALPALVAWVG